MTTKQERIILLLENYLDVIHGLGDYQPSDEHTKQPILGMCRSWNTPAYRQLEKLRQTLRDEQPLIYWHLAETYLRPTFRRINRCTGTTNAGRHRCAATVPAWAKAAYHRHGRKSYRFVPHLERIVSQAVQPQQVDLAIQWLEHKWRGEIDIPTDLHGIAA